MKVIHFTLAFLLAQANSYSMSVDDEWPAFKEKFHKEYTSLEDEAYRKEIFSKNLEKINAHNKEYDEGKSTYMMGINQWTDLTHNEVRKFTHSPSESFIKLQELIKVKLHDTGRSGSLSNLPEEVDWRKKGIVSRVKDQDICGSCWSFSATGALEGQRALKTGTLVELSEQELIDCSWSSINEGCNGGQAITAFQYVVQNDGISKEDEYKYEARDSYCRSHGRDPDFKWTSFNVVLPLGNEIALQAAVATHGPIAAVIYSPDEFHNYKNGTFRHPECNKSMRINHAVLVVGYGADEGGPYWIVKNSWTTAWGMDGYSHIARNENNMCFIALFATYATGEKRTK